MRDVFFQGEDGIRGRNVTGVQTCALPLCAVLAAFAAWITRAATSTAFDEFPLDLAAWRNAGVPDGRVDELLRLTDVRSEERRVGKERRTELAEDELRELLNSDVDNPIEFS